MDVDPRKRWFISGRGAVLCAGFLGVSVLAPLYAERQSLTFSGSTPVAAEHAESVDVGVGSAARDHMPLRPRNPVIKPERTIVDPARYEAHVILVKFNDDLPIRMRNGMLVNPARIEAPLAESYPRLAATPAVMAGRWQRLADVPEEAIDEMRTTAQRDLGRSVADMNTYFHFFLAPGDDAGAVIDALNALDVVEIAEPVPQPPPPPRLAAHEMGLLPPDFQPLQGYLDPATKGIDAYFSWESLDTRGAGIRIVNIEYSFNPNHLDLPPVTVIGPTPQDPGFGPEHGTAVLGVLGATNNGWGTTGIAYESQLFFAGARTNGVWNVAGAMLHANFHTNPGDVILIEQQYPGDGGNFVPVEWQLASYNAIVTAVGNGKIVVAAAGNGNEDLDAAFYSQGNNGHWPFLPENDSGSIIVGGGHSPLSGWTDRFRMSYSTFGSRVNVQGWGQHVTTTGFGGLYNAEGPDLYYTSTFNGTSSASPIVAGACALLQGAYKKEHGAPALPSVLREVLMSTGSPQQGSTEKNIGPRPDIQAAAAELLKIEPPPPPPPTNDACTGSIIVQAGSVSFSNVNATTTGPDEPELCFFDGESTIQSDVWFRHTATCTGHMMVSLCNSSPGFDTTLALYGAPCPQVPGTAIACNKDSCGQLSAVTIPVTQGQIVRIRVGGHQGAQGTGTLTITCNDPEPPPCPADLGGPGASQSDGIVDIFDLLFILANWGACADCNNCPADISSGASAGSPDCVVDIFDLLFILANWGSCE